MMECGKTSAQHEGPEVLVDSLARGGVMMIPLMLASILALAIVIERLWSLRAGRIMPPEVIPEVHRRCREGRLDPGYLRILRAGSPLGTILAAALQARDRGRPAMRDATEHAGRQVTHELERYLNTLGTIASVSPYLGLLGSVIGMIEVFSAFPASGGLEDPARLAGGLSEILVATAAGLMVAIPSLILYRFLRGRITELTVRMEEEADHLVASLDEGSYASPGDAP